MTDEQKAQITAAVRNGFADGRPIDIYALLIELRIPATGEVCEWAEALEQREHDIAKSGLEAVERFEAATSHRAVGYHVAPAPVRRSILRRPRARAAGRTRRTTSRVALAGHGPPGRPADDDRPHLASRILARMVALVRRRP